MPSSATSGGPWPSGTLRDLSHVASVQHGRAEKKPNDERVHQRRQRGRSLPPLARAGKHERRQRPVPDSGRFHRRLGLDG
jgi:hypothetical protein